MKKRVIFVTLGLFIILGMLTACGGETTKPENPLTGTSWRLLYYRKSTVMEGTEITATFEDGQVKGMAGCNSYFGAYQVQGQRLTVGQVGVTEMFCMEPEGLMEQEAFYLETLGDAQRYEFTDGRLMIFRSDGEALTFEPME
jgi:heat shock protein HslJ